MYSYLILFLAFISVSNAFDCLHHMCSSAFKACNHTAESHSDTKECWNWADETFHCCHECETCDTVTKPTATDDDCNFQLCDKIFDACTSVSNSSNCQEIADDISHCCYACLYCPPTSRAKFIHTNRYTNYECAPKFCNAVYVVCTETNDKSPQECMQIADEASACCDACDACEVDAPSKNDECVAETCNKVFNMCNNTHPQNTTDCWERADVASHCCYYCIECPLNAKPPTPRYDHCLKDLCNDVYQNCIDADHSSDKCRTMANHASECCNMCADCNQ